MISTSGGMGGGGFTGALGAGGPLTPQGIYKLISLFAKNRRTEDLVPNDPRTGLGGSFPGHNPDGSPIEGWGDPENDPWQYATFNNPSQTGGINPGANTPQVGGGGGIGLGGGIGGALGKLGDVFKGNAKEILPWAQLGAGVASNIYGASKQNEQFNKVNEQTMADKQRMYLLAEEEKKRRDAMIAQLMPLLGRDMNSPKIGSMLGTLGSGQ